MKMSLKLSESLVFFVQNFLSKKRNLHKLIVLLNKQITKFNLCFCQNYNLCLLYFEN